LTRLEWRVTKLEITVNKVIAEIRLYLNGIYFTGLKKGYAIIEKKGR